MTKLLSTKYQTSMEIIIKYPYYMNYYYNFKELIKHFDVQTLVGYTI